MIPWQKQTWWEPHNPLDPRLHYRSNLLYNYYAVMQTETENGEVAKEREGKREPDRL